MARHSSDIQSVVFEKDKGWTLRDAQAWLRQHHFKTDPDIKPTQLRFRQHEHGQYRRFRTMPIENGKINLVIGFR